MSTEQYNSEGRRVGSLDDAPKSAKEAATRYAVLWIGGGEVPVLDFPRMMCPKCSSDKVDMFYQIDSYYAIWKCETCDCHWVDECDIWAERWEG